jgi:hypothetical protein
MKLRPRLTLFTALVIGFTLSLISVTTLYSLRYVLEKESAETQRTLFQNFRESTQDALYLGDDLAVRSSSESLERSVAGLAFAVFVDESRPGIVLGGLESVQRFKRLSPTCATTASSGPFAHDFNCLESILKEIQNDASRMEELKQKESKEIIIVMTDGRSDSPQRVQKVIEELRNLGVVVVAIGITEGGRSVETTYGNNGNQDFAKVAGKASDLPIVLGDVLFDNLKDL